MDNVLLDFETQPLLMSPTAASSQLGPIQNAVRSTLAAVGEDPDREGLVDTPNRVARMYDELLAGYNQDVDRLVNNALFDVEYDDLVLVRDIEFSSLCEHHMLPFVGRVHVAYIPIGRVIGLSKIPRIVEMFARRLQVQERMTRQIASTLEQVLSAKGVAVATEGLHFCSLMRGVKKANARMFTSTMLGTFHDDAAARSEFMNLVNRPAAGSGFDI
ncbi:MAG: GTP cyclohydrolase I FolE [Anaerolineales bacterium]